MDLDEGVSEAGPTDKISQRHPGDAAKVPKWSTKPDHVLQSLLKSPPGSPPTQILASLSPAQCLEMS